jgi:acetyltransferase
VDTSGTGRNESGARASRLLDVRIRRTRPTDADELERFYAGLSLESRRLRFFGGCRGISHDQSVSFCTPDHEHREGFVAVAPGAASHSGRIVGHLCLEPVGSHEAEVAVAVADAWQRRGIGRRLTHAGIDWARTAGITTLRAVTLAENGAIRHLLGGLGYSTTVSWADAEVADVVIDLASPRTLAA